MRNRTRISPLDAFGLRDQRSRIYPTLEAGDGSTLSLDFTAMNVLDSRLTFTRASTVSTFINASGLIATAGTDVPRFDYNPITLASRGLLIEGSATNLLQRSNAFNTSPWATNGYTHSTGSTSPHSTESSQRMTVTGSGTLGNIQTVIAASTSLTFSVWWKNGNWTGSTGSAPRELAIRNNTTATMLLRFRIENPTTTPTAGYITGTSGVSFQNYGNGWYRIIATVTSGITAGNTIGIYIGGLLGSFVGSGEYADWYGAQVEAGAEASSYIPTTNSTVQRANDVCSMTGVNFISWFGLSAPSAFTTTLEGDVVTAGSYARILNFSSGTNNNGLHPDFNIGVASAVSNRPFLNSYIAAANNVDIYVPVGGAVTNGVAFKLAARCQAQLHRITRGSGLAVSSSYNGVPEGLASLYFGASNGVYQVATHYAKVKFWPTALTDAQMDVLAT